MNLSFAGCGFLGVYHLGVAKCLVNHAPNFLRSIKAFAGASAGSLAAAMLATSAPIDKCSDYVVDLTNEARKNPLGPFSRQFDLVGNLRKGMEEYLPSNCHKIASGRLFISVTSLKERKNYVISEYESKDELMKVLLASCYIPFYVGLDFPEFKGQKWADGGLTNNLPVLPFGETILISPFSGNDMHISPEDESQGLTDITFRNMNIYVNRENLQRELRMFIPPKKEGIEEIVQKGYDDALKFLHKKNLCDHSLLKWFDGGFTDNLPIPPQGDTILVSPFSGNSHICPQDASRPLSEFYWRKMHVLVNKENAKRGLNVLYPPKIDGVDKLFSTGFDDAMRFLKTNGFIG